MRIDETEVLHESNAASDIIISSKSKMDNPLPSPSTSSLAPISTEGLSINGNGCASPYVTPAASTSSPNEPDTDAAQNPQTNGSGSTIIGLPAGGHTFDFSAPPPSLISTTCTNSEISTSIILPDAADLDFSNVGCSNSAIASNSNGLALLNGQSQLPPAPMLMSQPPPSALTHGYAGFNQPEPDDMLPDSMKTRGHNGKRMSIQTRSGGGRDRMPVRRLSPVPTAHRRQAIQLQEERAEKRRLNRVEGVGLLLDFLKGGELRTSVEPTPDYSHHRRTFTAANEPPANRMEQCGSSYNTENTRAQCSNEADYYRDRSVGMNIDFDLLRTPSTSLLVPAADGSGEMVDMTFMQMEQEQEPAVVLPTTYIRPSMSVLMNSNNNPDELPPEPAHPTEPAEMRKAIRSKMLRCKRCKNRFVERGVYERHLKDRHPDDFIIYMAQQEEEMDSQRREELEQMRHEEIQCGGFIPPASDVDANTFDNINPNNIPLPGENSNGSIAKFDRYGGVKLPKKTYRKKVSPQCPFCDKRFRNESSLRKHVGKKHVDCVHYVQCNRCYKALKNIDDVGTHVCEMKYVCFECVPIRNLCTEGRLYNHRMKFHRGANSGFRCNECARKFLTPRKLRKHKKMAHVVTKPYKCHFCEDFFPTETQVALHERIHTGKVRYECPLCDFRSNRYPKLDKHKQNEHGYICSICESKMSEWAELKHHTLDVHGGYLTSEKGARFVESPRVWILYKGE